MTWPGALILSMLGVTFAVLVSGFPMILAAVCGVVLVAVILAIDDRRRLARLAVDRPGESICTFARSFDCRAVDPWIIRAVFEELQPYCAFGRRVLPLRATDTLEEVLRIDPEDLEDLASDIAYRAGRTLEDCEKNPYYGKIETVSDLVQFFVHQPSSEAT